MIFYWNTKYTVPLVFWCVCILIFLHFVLFVLVLCPLSLSCLYFGIFAFCSICIPVVFCCICILLHLYFCHLYFVILYFVVFVFCVFCILSCLYLVSFVFWRCILSFLYYGAFIFWLTTFHSYVYLKNVIHEKTFGNRIPRKINMIKLNQKLKQPKFL